MVLAAGEASSPKADAALEALCKAYWYPSYAFVRREGFGPDEAKDLTQSFFSHLLERRDFASIRQERGRFRSYLLTALKHFLIGEWRRTQAQKRGGGQAAIPLDEILAEERYGQEPIDRLSADRIFERRWASALLEQVFVRLGQEYSAAGKARLFGRLKELLSDEPGRSSPADIGLELGMTENAVRQALHRLRVRYRSLLREEVAQTVGAPGEIEEELRYLVRVLRS